mgnify:FL=1
MIGMNMKMDFKILILLTLTTFLIEAKPTKHVKECVHDSDCAQGFGCIMAKKFGKLICAKRKSSTANLDYTNQEYSDEEGSDYDNNDKGEGNETQCLIITQKSLIFYIFW